MARKKGEDRGLFQRANAAGKKLWWVRLWDNKRERKFGSFLSKSAARTFYNKAQTEQAERRFNAEAYHRNHSPLAETVIANHLAVSIVKNQSAEKHYGAWWTARLKGVRLKGITPTLLDEAKRELIDEGFASQTVLHYMKFLRHILNGAVRAEILTRNPFDGVTLPKPAKGKTRFLSVLEEARVLAALGPTYASWARFAILTGLRLSEQMRMRWADVNVDESFVTLPTTKSGDVQVAKLNQEAVTILQSLPRRKGSPWCFPSTKNPLRPMDQRNFTSRIFAPAVARAGLTDVTWHTLRHTTASRAGMLKHNETTIAALLRHSTTSLAKRYTHLDPDYLAKVLEDVSQFGRQPDLALFGTGPETGPEGEDGEPVTMEVVEKMERAMGFEPTTTSLGS